MKIIRQEKKRVSLLIIQMFQQVFILIHLDSILSINKLVNASLFLHSQVDLYYKPNDGHLIIAGDEGLLVYCTDLPLKNQNW